MYWLAIGIAFVIVVAVCARILWLSAWRYDRTL